jgi:hypothetical protein
MPPVPLGIVTDARPFPPCRKRTGSCTHLFPRLLFTVHWSGREPLSAVPEVVLLRTTKRRSARVQDPGT